jgi:hypothetical protein
MATPDEVYKEFGRAAEHAQHFESALGSVLLVYKIFENETKSAPIYDGYYLDVLRKIDRNTLGALLRKVSEQITVHTDLMRVFEAALKARNYLTHNFYREQGGSIETEAGRDAMLTCLAELQRQLAAAQDAAEFLLRRYVKDQGPPPSGQGEAQQRAPADGSAATRQPRG